MPKPELNLTKKLHTRYFCSICAKEQVRVFFLCGEEVNQICEHETKVSIQTSVVECIRCKKENIINQSLN